MKFNKERDEKMRRSRRRKRISFIAIGNLIGMLASATYIIDSLYHAIVKVQTMTCFGFLTFILALIVFGTNFSYFEERWGK